MNYNFRAKTEPFKIIFEVRVRNQHLLGYCLSRGTFSSKVLSNDTTGGVQ